MWSLGTVWYVTVDDQVQLAWARDDDTAAVGELLNPTRRAPTMRQRCQACRSDNRGRSSLLDMMASTGIARNGVSTMDRCEARAAPMQRPIGHASPRRAWRQVTDLPRRARLTTSSHPLPATDRSTGVDAHRSLGRQCWPMVFTRNPVCHTRISTRIRPSCFGT